MTVGARYFSMGAAFLAPDHQGLFPHRKRSSIPPCSSSRVLTNSTNESGTYSAATIPGMRSEIVGNHGGDDENASDTTSGMDQIFRQHEPEPGRLGGWA